MCRWPRRRREDPGRPDFKSDLLGVAFALLWPLHSAGDWPNPLQGDSASLALGGLLSGDHMRGEDPGSSRGRHRVDAGGPSCKRQFHGCQSGGPGARTQRCDRPGQGMNGAAGGTARGSSRGGAPQRRSNRRPLARLRSSGSVRAGASASGSDVVAKASAMPAISAASASRSAIETISGAMRPVARSMLW